MKIVIAGGHGFIGSHLVSFLREEGHEVIVLARKEGSLKPFWDPSIGKLDPAHLEGASAVINLAGEAIVGRWTKKKREQIQKSRLAPTKLLVDTIASLHNKPLVYIGASAIGYYGDRGDQRLTEKSPRGEGYLAELCQLWEEIPNKLDIRVAIMRIGVVLGNGGMLAKLLPVFKWGLGGVVGSGDQWMSWIAMEDLCRAFLFVLEGELAGPINCVAPIPATNRVFTKSLGEKLNRPTRLAVPAFILRGIFGSGADIFLASSAVLPEKLERAGFQFHCRDIQSALKEGSFT